MAASLSLKLTTRFWYAIFLMSKIYQINEVMAISSVVSQK
jgi:hypothetical protein